MNVIIVGTGAVAAELTAYIQDQNKHVDKTKQIRIIGYIDFKENIKKYWAKYNLSEPVLGDINSYKIKNGDQFIIGIADINFRMKIISALKDKRAIVTNFIHYTCIISSSAKVGNGNIIYPHCIIGPNCVVGNFNLITAYSFISHDCIIGDNNFFSTAGLSGHVSVGNNNFFGIRSTVLPKISIGSNNIVQAGMTIDKDVENETTVFYRYKEKVIAIPKT